MLPIFKGFLYVNQIASGMNQELFGPFKERNRLPQSSIYHSISNDFALLFIDGNNTREEKALL